MRNLIIVLFVFAGITLHAQRMVEKEVDCRGESVKMKFDLASDIDVQTWSKSSILVKASVETEHQEDTEEFELTVTRNESGIEIASNSLEIFKEEDDDPMAVTGDHDFEFNYTVYVPEGVELELSSITGSLTSEYLEGNIKIDLITGNIDIKKFEGELALKTITGKINLPVKDTSFEAKTVMGEIYANANTNLVKQEHFVGQKMKLDLKESKNRLSLSTVTGDIYLQ